MPVFIYKAKQDNAQTVSGEVTARDAEEAVDLVAQLGLLPVSVEEKGIAARGVLAVDPLASAYGVSFLRAASNRVWCMRSHGSLSAFSNPVFLYCMH